jgi:hypothetical protein
MDKLPRKLKKKIPKGFYCYTGINFDLKTGIYHIKECGFAKRVIRKSVLTQLPEWELEYIQEFQTQEEKDTYLNGKIIWCTYCNCEPEDQTKSCNVNYGKYR